MSNTNDHSLIRAYFIANWSDQIVTVFDNQPTIEIDESLIWCRFSIQSGASRQETMGSNPSFLQLGRIYLQVFIPAQTGIAAGNQVADDFSNLFRNTDISHIHCFSPETNHAYRSTFGNQSKIDEAFYQLNVSIPYESQTF